MSSATLKAWWSAVLLAVLALGFVLYTGARAYRSQLYQFRPHPHPVAKPSAGGEALHDVSFEGPGGIKIRGWYSPSANGAAIVLCHGSVGDRTSVLPEALALHARGFGTLVYDSPGHGESEGEVDWDAREQRTLRDAISWIEQRPDVRPGHVGVYGFSMGGLVSSMVAARDPRVRALVSAAAPAHLRRQAAFEFSRWGPFSQIPAQWALVEGGQDIDGPDPLQLIHQVSPRPVLIVTGDADPIVQPNLASELYAAAREPKQLLVVHGAGHGSYAEHRADYHERLAAFFTRALLPAH